MGFTTPFTCALPHHQRYPRGIPPVLFPMQTTLGARTLGCLKRLADVGVPLRDGINMITLDSRVCCLEVPHPYQHRASATTTHPLSRTLAEANTSMKLASLTARLQHISFFDPMAPSKSLQCGDLTLHREIVQHMAVNPDMGRGNFVAQSDAEGTP